MPWLNALPLSASPAAPIWEAQRHHPFVRGIGDATLDVEQFSALGQTGLLYGSIMPYVCHGGSQSPICKRWQKFAERCMRSGCEMDLHRSYAREWGISAEGWKRAARLQPARAIPIFCCAPPRLGAFLTGGRCSLHVGVL